MTGTTLALLNTHFWTTLGIHHHSLKKKSPTEEWIKKIYMYTMEYYSAIKRNKIVPFAETWMDLETVIQSEVSQEEKNKYRILTIYVESRKMI